MEDMFRMQTLDGYMSERVDIHENALFGYIDKSGKYYIPQRIKNEF